MRICPAKVSSPCSTITSMSDIICITNRALCHGGFLAQLEKIASAQPRALVLREKDLSEDEYSALAIQFMEICRRYGVQCILHSFYRVAEELGADAVHLPLPLLRQMPDSDKQKFRIIGASCHSTADAAEAKSLGAGYITLGHIFATDCKKGLAPRGLGLLGEVCRAVDIPVYAIGGISADNIESVRRSGASGACVMSGLMTCNDPSAYLEKMAKGAVCHEI